MRVRLPILLFLVLSAFAIGAGRQAAELRDRAIAELENERPANAEKELRRLVELEPADPLGHANLAVALLRQQKYDEALAAAKRAQAKAPGRADLSWIEAEILAASGKPSEALASLASAARAAPDDPEVQFALLRQAEITPGAESERLLPEALERLARLRPENLLVSLTRGRQALAAGDRTAATGAYLRIRELLWNAPPMAAGALERLLVALEAGKLDQARVPSLQLENVLKVSPAYQRSLQELSLGIQGKPVLRFTDEPPPVSFGEPRAVTFRPVRLSEGASAGRALVAADFDGDDRPDLARARSGKNGGIEIFLAAAEGNSPARLPAPGVKRLLSADLDNDGHLDLIAFGGKSLRVFRGTGDGSFVDATTALGLENARASAAVVLDFDGEGDLDLAAAGTAPELYRNALSGPLTAVGASAFPELALAGVRDLVASDLDGDGDVDLLFAGRQGLVWLDNLRQGRFADRTRAGGLSGVGAVEAVVRADLDGDGRVDLVAAGEEGLISWRNAAGRFERWELHLPAGSFRSLVAFDADNDGRLDLAAAGPRGVIVVGQKPGAKFEPMSVVGETHGLVAVVAEDLDGDGDLDLAAVGNTGLFRLENEGGNRNHWLRVRLRGLTDGNGKNNIFGLGATLEVRAGGAYQFREVSGPVTHLGLGRQTTADLLRVVWTNGVPQNRLAVAGDQRIVEEQVLKGSCPYLYAWNGERFEFVTDLLWGAPLGLPLAPGVWAPSDSRELVAVPGAAASDGIYRLRITEELWEAAYFDSVRLWVVDHPTDVEVASTLRIVPGAGAIDDRVLGSRRLRPLAGARDGRGEDVTERLVARDDVYASGFERSPYQGVAREPWALTLDLGEAPAAPVRLHLDGWIFPADASLNLAVAQRTDLAPVFPRLEVETGTGWRILVADVGHPAGKTKTMVVDTPPLPPGAHRLRLVSSLWLAFDRIVWTTVPADGEAVVRARITPHAAELRYRGFSQVVRRAPNAPHALDYARVSAPSPWLPFPGRYTRYGEVTPLLSDDDDRLLILAPGDEAALDFDASGLAAPRDGWTRSVFLESVGWDKDADRNTWEAKQVGPLPFRAMTSYPYAPGESYPDDDGLRAYVDEWLTRQVGDSPG